MASGPSEPRFFLPFHFISIQKAENSLLRSTLVTSGRGIWLRAQRLRSQQQVVSLIPRTKTE